MMSFHKTQSSAVKIAILFLAIVMMASSFAACRGGEEIEVVESDFSVYLGNTLDPITVQSVIDRFEAETGLTVEPVYTDVAAEPNSNLKRSIKSGDPVAAFLAAEGEELDGLIEESFLATIEDDARDVHSLVDGNRIAQSWRADGLISDSEVLRDLFGLPDAVELISDIQASSYEEFADFVIKLDEYISIGTPNVVNFAGKPYGFAEAKTAETAKLTGVFALSGADKTILGSRLMNVVLSEIDQETWIQAKSLPDEEAIEKIGPGMDVYLNTLDLLTSHLAGLFASGIRGDSWTSSKNYSVGEVEKIFMKGKAVFTFDSMGNSESFSKIDPAKADTLVLLPVKLPLGDLAIPDGKANSEIALTPKTSFAINAEVPEEIQAAALKFVEMLDETLLVDATSLEKSAESYWISGNYFPYNSESEEIRKYLKDSFKKNNELATFFATGDWTPEARDLIRLQLITAWKNS
ncbi:MAG: hypothetical protein LBN34_10065 [Clostridiales Family XIII bacterium]|jgi:hypothetical protein|nr:hypothetical protein [Clostridiales Family XIII bacterium]